MKLSKIYLWAWILLGLGLIFINWRLTVIWIVSGFLNGLSEYYYKKETKPKNKGVPSYID